MYACTVSTGYTSVNGLMQPFFKGGAMHLILNMVSLRLQHVRIVHHLCTVSTDYTRVNVYVHSVHKCCTVSICMHSVYTLCKRCAIA